MEEEISSSVTLEQVVHSASLIPHTAASQHEPEVTPVLQTLSANSCPQVCLGHLLGLNSPLPSLAIIHLVLCGVASEALVHPLVLLG